MIPYDEIDASLVEMIRCLHEAGYCTISSCSGMRRDHPKGFPRTRPGRPPMPAFLLFDDVTFEQEKRIRLAARHCGWSVVEVPETVRLVIETPRFRSDEKGLQAWRCLELALLA